MNDSAIAGACAISNAEGFKNRDLQLRPALLEGQRCPKAGEATADDYDVISGPSLKRGGGLTSRSLDIVLPPRLLGLQICRNRAGYFHGKAPWGEMVIHLAAIRLPKFIHL